MLIEIHDDFDLEKIYNSGQCFRIKKFENGVFRFITADNVLHIKCKEPGVFEIDSPKEWDTVWHNYFDLSRNYNEIAQNILPHHSKLKQMAHIGKGIRIVRQEHFEMLITFIISQRKSIPAIKTSVERLCALCGQEIELKPCALLAGEGENGTQHTKSTAKGEKQQHQEKGENFVYKFPSAKSIAALSYEELASCGLGYRVPYVANAARIVSEDEQFLRRLSNLPNDELLAKLTAFKGVGAKVANCIALFAYARVNCAPVDVWIARVLQRDFGGEDIFAEYENNAGIYQQYMFYSAVNTK